MFSVVKNYNGHFEHEMTFQTFQEAVSYMEHTDPWGRWIVPSAVANMIDEVGVSDLDTPNFRHFDINGKMLWYADPTYRAKMVFEKLTGISLNLVERGPGLLPMIEGTDLEANVEEISDGTVAIDIYYGGVETHLHLDIYPEFFRVFWSDDMGFSSSPPEPLPAPEFFRAFLGLP